MYFDRSRTYRAIAHILDVPHQVIQERIERTTIREEYELGKLSDEAFLAALREAAGAQDPELTDAFLTEFWGDIFWPNNEMIGALHQLKKGNLFLVMLSNTNHIHFAHVMKDYPELDSLFDEFVLSYEVGSNKPHHEIFARGIKTVVDQVSARDGRRYPVRR